MVFSHQGGLSSEWSHCTLVVSCGTSQRQSGGDDGNFFLMELCQKERINTCEESVLSDSWVHCKKRDIFLLLCYLSGFSFFDFFFLQLQLFIELASLIYFYVCFWLFVCFRVLHATLLFRRSSLRCCYVVIY